MLALLTAVALVLAASTLLGSAACRLAGCPPSRAAVPVGFAALLVLAGSSVRLPGRAVASTVAVAVALVLSALYLRHVRAWTVVPRWTLPMAAVVALLAMIPFAVSGRVGLLGVGTNDDLSEHLLAAWTLRGNLPISASKLIVSGYPIGPHAIAAAIAVATGMSVERAFTGLIVAVPALLALAAVALMPDGRRGLRASAAVLVGLCYLQAAYLVQASFKEPIESVILIAFVAVLAQLERQRPRSSLCFLPLAALAAGAVYVNSYLGLLWPAGTLLLWLAMRAVVRRQRRRVLLAVVRSWAWPVAIAAAVFLALIAPELSRMLRFSHSSYNQEGPTVYGDLLRRMPPLEALGIWPRLDFRFDIPLGSLGGVLALLAVPALVVTVLRCMGRRDFLLPSALLCSAALYGLSATRSPYTVAKGLVIAAPLLTLLLAREALLLARETLTVGRGVSSARSWRAAGAAVLAVLLLAGAYSDLEVIRDGPVGPASHPNQLAVLRGLIGRHPTLFLGDDDYIHWELRGVDVATPPEPLYTRTVVPLRWTKAQPAVTTTDPPGATTTTNRFAGLGLAFDFDSVPPAVLDRFTYAIVPRSGYGSPAPPNWRMVRSTRSYELWRRTAPTGTYQTLTAIDNPGAILDCTTPSGRAIARVPGVAMVEPEPVLGQRTSWRGTVGYAGRSVYQILHLGSGTWQISLQYDSTVDLTVRGPGMRAVLPASIEPLGAYWYVGRVHLARPAWARITVSAHRLPVFGRIVGAFGLTRPPVPTGLRALGQVAATRAPSRDRLIPLRRACGRYVDWYRTS